MTQQRWLFFLALLTGGLLCTPSAHAVPLASGQSVQTAALSHPPMTLVASETIGFHNLSSRRPITGLAGTLHVAVYREAGGTLDFLYQVKNGPKSHGIQSFAAGVFPNFTTNVGYMKGKVPAGFVRGSVADGTTVRNGDTVSFLFKPNLNRGQTTKVLFIRTNATALTTQGSVTVTAKDPCFGRIAMNGLFAPLTPSGAAGGQQVGPAIVPEPGSLALMLGMSAPAAGVYLWRRRRLPS
jgi:hypothetical protein